MTATETDMDEPGIGVIDSERYTLGRVLGKGTWGKVYEAEDSLTGKQVAVKVLDPNDLAREQMQHRELSEMRVAVNEDRKLMACSNVVPGVVEVDRKGRPYIVMPRYRRFMSDLLNDNGNRSFLGNGFNLEQILKFSEGIANGISEMHSKLRRAHGDIKPDNLAVSEKGDVLVNDLGSSTCASLSRRSSPRDNVGFLYTRAPECFRADGHPGEKSDVWAFGSLMYRMFTGKYILEEELSSAESPAAFMTELKEDDYDDLVKRKLKKVPRKFRKFLGRCLSYSPYPRFYTGEEMKQGLERVVENLNGWKVLKSHSKKLGLGLGVPMVVAGLLAYAAVTHEPQELTIPQTNIQGPLYIPRDPDEKVIEFAREDVKDLPPVARGYLLNPDETSIKRPTDNRVAACLLKSYLQTAIAIGALYADIYTEEQAALYSLSNYQKGNIGHGTVDNPRFEIPARSIEFGLEKAVRPDGKVDLEDALVIARIGLDKWNKARRTANSSEFRDYITAKNSEGKYIIPEKEQRFVNQWLAQTGPLFE